MFEKTLNRIRYWFEFQGVLKRGLEYDQMSDATLLSLISENVKRLTIDIEVLRDRINGKVQHDNPGSGKEAE